MSIHHRGPIMAYPFRHSTPLFISRRLSSARKNSADKALQLTLYKVPEKQASKVRVPIGIFHDLGSFALQLATPMREDNTLFHVCA